ncbi:hypothetical protein H072_3909 [Dactylellina haptotyla CBS 200.50]|uniref:Peptidase S8/S53 domain-containing protein n=1 Tax=Dactylellina haptotyla (strain CBS 200.50) TaxID=1284197 RepID=S8AGJ3_DACHA|nr:hypothetical protein H072_3909 [Dactylellina haptotyla CBS 200.50]
MKSSVILSGFLFILTQSTVLAAPINQVSELAKDDSDNYVVILADDDKRPWGQVFQDMGYNMSESSYAASENVHTFGTNYGSMRTFGTNFRAFTMSMKKSEGASILSLPNVASVEKDVVWSAPVQPRNPAYKIANMTNHQGSQGLAKRQQNTGAIIRQSTAPWGLGRISSERALVSNGRQVTDLKFNYDFEEPAGSGVDVYMLDTGINTDHVDFGGRAQMVFTAFGNDMTDGAGHGSHTAGTVGSMTFGVAKNVNLWGVKVLDDQNQGTLSAFMAGVDFALASHNKRKAEPGFKASILSMSLGGPGFAQGLFQALQRATEAGIHVSVAGGNDNTDACQFSPAAFSRQLPIITVGATNVRDQKADFSNFGPCIDIHAPGEGIVSTYNQGPTSTFPESGTSMACPAVTGAMAIELAKNPSLDPASLKRLIISKGLNGVLRGTQGGDGLLNTGFRGTG